MKLRTLTTILTVGVLLLGYAIGAAQKRKRSGPVKTNRWHVFVNPDKDFVLAFPGTPTLKDVGPGPLTDLRELEFVTPDGLRLSANFHDIGGDPDARDRNQWLPQLEQILSDFDRSQGYRVVQMHRVTPNIIEAEIWQSVPEANTKINYLRRSIIRRARIYTLACGWVVNEKTVDAKVCQRFFGSMHFIAAVRKSQPHRKR